jgi:hypothetical protein
MAVSYVISVLLFLKKKDEVWSMKHEADNWSPFIDNVTNASNYARTSALAQVFMTCCTPMQWRSVCVEIHLITSDK